MTSHPVAVLRFAARVVAVLGIALGILMTTLGIGPSFDLWAWVIYGAVAVYVVSVLAGGFDVPRGAKAADDELVRWSETRSHAFGYWVTLLTFLGFLWAVRRDAIPAEIAFSALGLPLGFAPIVYMIVAFLRGRAG